MSTKTYNTGRVVGWSTYEEFLKENPSVDPTTITAQVYQTMVTYGAARRVSLPMTGWSGTTILTQTVAVPGAIWGVVPIVGINYDAYTDDQVGSAAGKVALERAVGTVFSCYTSNSTGVKAQNVSSETGYLTFCAYPDVVASGLATISLIVRGLGADALNDGEYYLGPQGLMFSGNAFGAKGATSSYQRALPTTAGQAFVNMDAVVDMRTTDPKTYYQNHYSEAGANVDVGAIEPLNGDAAILSLYQLVPALPPALFGTKLAAGEVGAKKLYPVDTVAPGTVKLYQPDSVAGITDARSQVTSLETGAEANVGLYRDPISGVIYERSPNPDLRTSETFPPVSEDNTVNVNGLMSAATNWIFFFSHGPHGEQPTFEEMQTVGAPLYLEIRSGSFSPRVVEEYGVSYADWLIRKDQFTIGVGVYGGFWDGIPEGERDDWCCMLTGPADWAPLSIKTGSYLLVNKTTGAIYSYQSATYQGWSLPPLDFGYGAVGSGSTRTYKQSLVDFMGTWWGVDDNSSYPDSEGASVISNPRHKHIKDVASSETASFYMPNQLVPEFSSAYHDFREYFGTVAFSDFLAEMGTDETAVGLHADFHGKSLQEILELGAIKDLTRADTPDNRQTHINISNFCVYKPDAWPIAGRVVEDLHPMMQVQVPGVSYSQYDMRIWTIAERETVDSPWVDTTRSVNRTATPVWAANAQSGHHKTTAISLVDQNGVRLPLYGTADRVLSDYITWDNLLTCLNQNRRLDLLGEVLRGLKVHVTDSGDNYIEFNQTTSGGHKLRLYISNTPPSGARDGDIGIGW